MSISQYNSEPPTSGRVKLQFSTGDAVVELWSRECPKACRNFVQLCLEGYYDGCLVHRIIKDLLLQMGDPSGTGAGGESVYGTPFKTEVHSRLQFTRRGLLAMAGSGEDNGSQFFITLGPCSWLNKKHTIFGRVAGNGIFNVTPMGELETDEADRPMFPPKLVKATVLDNPFDDIVPREPQRPQRQEEKPKRKGRRDLSLVSFGEEAQEEESQMASVATDAYRIRSSHDVLSDTRLLKETAYDEEELRASREKAKEAEEKRAAFQQRVKAAAAKSHGVTEEGTNGETLGRTSRAPTGGDGGPLKSEKDMTLSELSMKRAEEAAQEYQRLKMDMLRYKKAKRQEEEERRRREADPQLTALEERRLKYLNKKSPKTEKEQRTLQRMAVFKNMLSMTMLRQQAEEKRQAALKRAQADSDDDDEDEVDFVPVAAAPAAPAKKKREEPSDNPGVRMEALLDAEDDEGDADEWLHHEMKCDKKHEAEDEDDGYVVLDRLNGQSLSKASLQLQGTPSSDQRKRPKLT